MQEILIERVTQLIDTAKEKIIDNIASTRRSTREKAINCLTALLDPTSEEDKIIFQTIPLELIERGEIIWAIRYIETIWKRGDTISMEVFEKVIEEYFIERFECEEAGDDESLKELDSSMRSMFHMAQRHQDLKDTSRLFLRMWRYEEIKGNPYKAISHYDSVIAKQEIDWYLAKAMVYEELGQYENWLIILDMGYAKNSDARLLWESVRLLCKMGKMVEAHNKYQQLQFLEEGIPPFIVYKGFVENDKELWEVEQTIASYITSYSFVPSEALAALAKSSTYYIAEQVNMENENLAKFDFTTVEDWTDDNYTEYSRVIFRRLKLFQIDILTLCNHRYVSYYLRDLEKVWLDWSSNMRESLADFFVDNSSEEVIQAVIKRGKKEQITSSNESESGNQKDFSASLFGNISMHVSRVWELFFQEEFYNIQKEQILPLLKKSALQEWDFDEELEDNLSNILHSLKDCVDYYNNLRPAIREDYENFLQQIDFKYGAFYRRHLQALAMNPAIKPQQYPEALWNYPDIALLFWMQKIISWQFPTNNPEEIDKIVQQYSLDRVNISNALLFGALLFGISIEYAVWFIADFPNLLDEPRALYIVTEGLRSMDKKDRNIAIRDLHDLARERYDARGFFDHIRHAFGDIYKHEPSEEDTSDMLLTRGNMVILQNKERVQALLNFHIAWSEFGSLEGLLQAGDLHENLGEYDRALDCFEQALLQDENNIGVLMKILNCTICSGKYDKAECYIQYWIRKWYSINNYILAFYLWQWNTLSAFLQMIQMIKESLIVVNMPEGLQDLLCETLKYVIDMPDSMNSETDILKIYASFILSNPIAKNIPIESNIFVSHWQYINSLSVVYEWELLHSLIEEALNPLTWELEWGNNSSISSSDQSVWYLDTHATNIYETYKDILNDTQDIDKQWILRREMNDFCGLVILTLRKFPDSEEYVKIWRNLLNIYWAQYPMPNSIQ
jgi:hypothetical protein